MLDKLLKYEWIAVILALVPFHIFVNSGIFYWVLILIQIISIILWVAIRDASQETVIQSLRQWKTEEFSEIRNKQIKFAILDFVAKRIKSSEHAILQKDINSHKLATHKGKILALKEVESKVYVFEKSEEKLK